MWRSVFFIPTMFLTVKNQINHFTKNTLWICFCEKTLKHVAGILFLALVFFSAIFLSYQKSKVLGVLISNSVHLDFPAAGSALIESKTIYRIAEGGNLGFSDRSVLFDHPVFKAITKEFFISRLNIDVFFGLVKDFEEQVRSVFGLVDEVPARVLLAVTYDVLPNPMGLKEHMLITPKLWRIFILDLNLTIR